MSFVKSVSLFVFLLTQFAIVSETQAKIRDIGPIDEVGSNFGIILDNGKYTFYRSGGLGEKGLKKMKAYLDREGMQFPKTIVYMNRNGFGRFTGISLLDKLHGKAEFALEELRLQKQYGYKFYHSFDYNNRTYLEGYNPYNPTRDIDKKSNIRGKSKRHITLNKDGKPDGGIEAFKRIMKIVLESRNQPVLFHCSGGKHRAGMITMAVRVIQGGYWTQKLKAEKGIIAEDGTAVYLDTPYKLEYYKYADSSSRAENIQFIERVQKEPFFQAWINKYSQDLAE